VSDTFDPRVAIDQFFQHKLTGAQLMRGLASYRGWIVPAAFDPAGGGDPTFIKIRFSETDRHFFMFSDGQAHLDCRARLGLEAMGTYTLDNIFGYNAWEAVDDDVDFVNINPFSPHEIHYKKDQIPMLREWGRIIRVEQAIDTILSTDKGYDIIKAFPSYYIGMIHDGDSSYIALAPDDKGRELAALFTTDDAADAYLEQNGQDDVQLRVMDGATLFDALSSTSLDGMVFNCCGPIRPRAFALPFAATVIQRG
jgi:hypothetical protein